MLINSAGRVLPDSIVSILALRASVKKGGVVILSENTSSAVEEEAVRMGCRVVRSRIGKSFAEIAKEGAVVCHGAQQDRESSMGDVGGRDVRRLADCRRCLQRARADEVHQLGTEMEVQASQHTRLRGPLQRNREVEAEFAKFRISEVRRLDGLKMVFKDGSWIMFRSSGTEPKTRIYCESLDQIRLEELLGTGEEGTGGLGWTSKGTLIIRSCRWSSLTQSQRPSRKGTR